jgi:hypothetical protein
VAPSDGIQSDSAATVCRAAPYRAAYSSSGNGSTRRNLAVTRSPFFRKTLTFMPGFKSTESERVGTTTCVVLTSMPYPTMYPTQPVADGAMPTRVAATRSI